MRKNLSLFFLVLGFVSILLFIDSKGYLSSAYEKTKTITAPASLFFSQFSSNASSFFSSIFKLINLQKENAQLREEVNKLKTELAQLAEVKKENENLKKLLGFVSANNYNYEAAEVIAYDPSNIRGMITLNKGKKQGVLPGMAVISEGFLIGRIYDASDNTSKVMLITDPESVIPVTLKSGSANGIVRGAIGLGLLLEKVPQDEKVSVGDTVISSGLGGDLPRGLILGQIEKVNKQDNSLFVSASLRPAANFNNLFRVLIIKK